MILLKWCKSWQTWPIRTRFNNNDQSELSFRFMILLTSWRPGTTILAEEPMFLAMMEQTRSQRTSCPRPPQTPARSPPRSSMVSWVKSSKTDSSTRPPQAADQSSEVLTNQSSINQSELSVFTMSTIQNNYYLKCDPNLVLYKQKLMCKVTLTNVPESNHGG